MERYTWSALYPEVRRYSRGSTSDTSRARAWRVQFGIGFASPRILDNYLGRRGMEILFRIGFASLGALVLTLGKGGRETPRTRCAGTLRDSAPHPLAHAENLRSNLV